ncbi:beta-ketoacyl synthase N-terminal-like domain-containing protein [Glycomyces tritici]|uniref:Beta-ketoacyl synthase N-terminal-like domain-containing protein n=1 Tax=Glycomyces tritici TaxID=2665176 RepID=A0ABT7YYU5_9ACTN|nr:beta-ketoacyl synthase N-terminal-like domain-containing protein [Glycomyces tritici]MDN3243810.1 beta-ketoacyl synthase N-terminal-like domain-containing protein [Glycomyces tritici]
MTWAVAGVGARCSVGSGVDEIAAALCEGRSGWAPLRGFDPAKYSMPGAYEIDDRPGGEDRPGRATGWLLEAIAQACKDAGLGDLNGVPVVIGTGLRELRTAELAWLDGSSVEESALDFGEAVRERFGAGEVHTVTNACSASLYALALGTDLLALGEADTVVVAGVDTITESMFGLLDRVQPDPPGAVRPFDEDRRGVVMGDGAVAVVLERGTGAWGTVRSVSVNCDAAHVTAPDEAGIAAAIRAAHASAGVTPGDIDLVLAHGTGTVLNDRTEALAMRGVFGPSPAAPMTAIKSMTGHTSGGSGLLSLVVALWCLREGRVPPVVGLEHPIEEAAGFAWATAATALERARLAQVNAFGFGGVNAVAVVEGGARVVA